METSYLARIFLFIIKVDIFSQEAGHTSTLVLAETPGNLSLKIATRFFLLLKCLGRDLLIHQDVELLQLQESQGVFSAVKIPRCIQTVAAGN